MDSKAVIKKRNIYLGLFIGVTVTFVVGIILSLALIESENTKTLIALVLTLGLTIALVYFRSVLYGYNQMVKIARIVLTQGEPLPQQTNLDKVRAYFVRHQYKVHADNEDYSILYINEVDKSLKITKIKKLKLALLIKKSKLDFFDQHLHDDIKKLEDSFSKKEFPNKYIILAFKEFNFVKDTQLKSIGEIVSYSMGKQSYNQINVGLNKFDQRAYFLYSDRFYPNAYFKEGVETIKDVIKL